MIAREGCAIAVLRQAFTTCCTSAVSLSSSGFIAMSASRCPTSAASQIVAQSAANCCDRRRASDRLRGPGCPLMMADDPASPKRAGRRIWKRQPDGFPVRGAAWPRDGCRYGTLERLVWRRRHARSGGEGANWRRGRDSNPRYGYPYAAFRVRCIQPLCHLSGIAQKGLKKPKSAVVYLAGQAKTDKGEGRILQTAAGKAAIRPPIQCPAPP